MVRWCSQQDGSFSLKDASLLIIWQANVVFDLRDTWSYIKIRNLEKSSAFITWNKENNLKTPQKKHSIGTKAPPPITLGTTCQFLQINYTMVLCKRLHLYKARSMLSLQFIQSFTCIEYLNKSIKYQDISFSQILHSKKKKKTKQTQKPKIKSTKITYPKGGKNQRKKKKWQNFYQHSIFHQVW